MVMKSGFSHILKTTLISRQHMYFTSKIKVDFKLDFKEQFWRILKTTLISRQLMNFSLISSQLEINLDLKKNSSDTFSKQPWFQGNLNFSQVHNVSFAGSGAFHVPQRICKVNTIKLVCCNRQFFYLVSDASKPDWRK